MPSNFLRDSSANFARNNSFLSVNRHNVIRDTSPADSRSRSPSVKRKANDSSYANAAKKSVRSGNIPSSRHSFPKSVPPPPPRVLISQDNLEKLDINYAKIASICEKLHDSILAIPEENPICPILREFCAIVHIQNENSKILSEAFCSAQNEVSATSDGPAAPPAAGQSESEMESDTEQLSQMVSLGRLPRSRGPLLPGDQRGRLSRDWEPMRATHSTDRQDHSPAPTPAAQRFRDLVNEAEKSSVIFNLDMGRVPIINKETMSIKATSALTAMAATAENRPGLNPSGDTVAAIDDALSVAEKISFFGNTTKSLTGKGAMSGAYCTIPVCYKFPSKDIRSKAEHVLRTRCKVSCATPYPQALRACIKAVIEDGKRARPDDFCSVTVDMAQLSLKVSWRAKDTSTWTRYDKLIPIPSSVMEDPNKVSAEPPVIYNLPTRFIAVPTSSPNPVSSPVVVRQATGLHDTVDTSATLHAPP